MTELETIPVAKEDPTKIDDLRRAYLDAIEARKVAVANAPEPKLLRTDTLKALKGSKRLAIADIGSVVPEEGETPKPDRYVLVRVKDAEELKRFGDAVVWRSDELDKEGNPKPRPKGCPTAVWL